MTVGGDAAEDSRWGRCSINRKGVEKTNTYFTLVFFFSPQDCAFIRKEDYFQSISKRHICQPIQKPCKTEHKRHHKYSTFVPIRLSRREIRHKQHCQDINTTACAKWQVSVIPVFSFGNMKFCSYIKSRHSHLRLVVTQNTFLKGLRRL